MKRLFTKHMVLLFSLLLVCVALDQATKVLAVRFLKGRPFMSFLGDIFRLGYAENSGAFLSLGAGLPEEMRQTIFVVLVSLFLLGFLLYAMFSKSMDRLPLAASAMIIGGGIGNLIDRILNKGVVVDFMNLGIGVVRTGIFNIADIAIMAGMFLFIIVSFKKPPDKK